MKRAKIVLHVDPYLRDALRKKAKERGVSITAFVSELVRWNDRLEAPETVAKEEEEDRELDALLATREKALMVPPLEYRYQTMSETGAALHADAPGPEKAEVFVSPPPPKEDPVPEPPHVPQDLTAGMGDDLKPEDPDFVYPAARVPKPMIRNHNDKDAPGWAFAAGEAIAGGELVTSSAWASLRRWMQGEDVPAPDGWDDAP